MRRVGIWILRILTGASLVLCTGVLAWWVRSHYRVDSAGVWWASHGANGGRWVGHGVYLHSYKGTITLSVNRYLQQSVNGRWGFGFGSYLSIPYHPPGVPHAVVACVLALLPAHRFTRWRARRRAKRQAEQGLCFNCSYNLAGNTSGVCPECGTPTVIKKPLGA
jgi:hypothetical protein